MRGLRALPLLWQNLVGLAGKSWPGVVVAGITDSTGPRPQPRSLTMTWLVISIVLSVIATVLLNLWLKKRQQQ